MAIKELQTRIALKYDSYENWTKDQPEGSTVGKNLVLLAGELGICEIPAVNAASNVAPTVLFKVGNGTDPFWKLPWASAKAADVYSWAKASDVRLTGKTLEFVGGKDAEGNDIIVKSIPLNYATPEEVAAAVKVVSDNLDKVDARVATLEDKFTGEGSVQGQLDALDGRLDVIEGSGEGSVAKTLVDAKAYTDEREVEIKKYADQAEADAKQDAADKLAAAKQVLEAADSALDARLDVIESTDETKVGSIAKALKDAKDYADQAELDAVATAKSYTDGRETAITTAYKAYADQAEADAKSYSDGKLAAAVSTLEAKDSAQDEEIDKKLDKATYDEYIVGKTMSDEELKAYADGKASAAQTAAETNAAATAQSKVDALANGAVAANARAIEAMDAAYKAADEALDGRLGTVEAKLANVTNVMDFRGAVTTLPASTEGYQDGDVIVVTGTGDAETDKDNTNIGKEFVVSEGAFVEFGNTDANTAAITALQGRMTAAEGDIDALETRANNLESADAAIEGRLDVIEGEGAGSIKKAQADAEAAAKSYTDGRETVIRSELKTAYEAYADKAEEDAVTTAKAYTDSEVKKLQGADAAIEEDVQSLQDVVDGYTTKGAIKTAVDAAAELAQTGVDNAATAKAAAEAAQGDVDTLEGIVNTLRSEYDVTKALATTNEAAIAAIDERVEAAEGEIDTLQAIVDSGNSKTIRDDVTALQTLTAGFDGTIKTAVDAAKKAGDDAAQAVVDLAAGQVATNKSDITKIDGRVTAIENDYVKASDLINDFYIFNCGSSTTVTHVAPAKAE